MLAIVEPFSGAWLLGLGALLSGMGSLVAALGALRTARKKADDDCDKRIVQVQKAFREGMRIGKGGARKGEDERWSHLP